MQIIQHENGCYIAEGGEVTLDITHAKEFDAFEAYLKKGFKTLPSPFQYRIKHEDKFYIGINIMDDQGVAKPRWGTREKSVWFSRLKDAEQFWSTCSYAIIIKTTLIDEELG